MGLFNRHRETTANLPADPASTLGSADTLPARRGTFGEQLQSGANHYIDKATQIYQKNPKLVGGLAVLAGALLLNRMKRPHH